MKQAYCPHCRDYVAAHMNAWDMGWRPTFEFVLVFLTCGLFLPVWLILQIFAPYKPYACSRCGWRLR